MQHHSEGIDTSNGAWKLLSRSGVRHVASDASLFSTSLPVFPCEKGNLNGIDHACQSSDHVSEVTGALENGLHDRESFLPDEDELLFGMMDDFQINVANQVEDDWEKNDVSGSGGGLIKGGQQEGLISSMSNISLSDDGIGSGHLVLPNGVGTVSGEHPSGEHPSRTLFVRNINSNVEDLELRALFQQYGDIRTMYTACKHRGFVMISYYDIRDAQIAMRALQNKPLRRRKLDIHFSIPKDNQSDKDVNHGSLVVFNLDPAVSNDYLRSLFAAYGEVKEIRETPNKKDQKFVEFYDDRDAEAALRSLNGRYIAGKRIKLELSRPGGKRRNLMVHQNQDLDPQLDEPLNFQHQLHSSIRNSSRGSWPQYGSPNEFRTMQSLVNSPGFGSLSHTMRNNLSALDSLLHPQASSSSRFSQIGNRGINCLGHKFSGLDSNYGSDFQQSHSVPDVNLNPISLPVSSFGGSSSKESDVESLSDLQFLWGSPGPQQSSVSSPWQAPSEGHPFTLKEQIRGLPYASSHGPPIGVSHHLPHFDVGSPLSNVPIGRRYGLLKESLERSFLNPVGLRGLDDGHNDTGFLLNMDGRVGSHMPEIRPPASGMMSRPRMSPLISDNDYYPSLRPKGLERFDHSWNKRVENSGHQMDSQNWLQLDIEKIIKGEDTRTTLMIKNIPNKYTSRMLMAVIDENFRGSYDLLYLPIDFKNKCNVGYAFINMVSPSHVIPFYQAFDGKRWEKFNSEKVASLAYARIQGKAALDAHFQKSSLMNEDRRCRPIVFNSEGSEAGHQQPRPSYAFKIQAHQSNVEDARESFAGSRPIENPSSSYF